MSLPDLVLVALALAFAWSMGAHYTGACMGMAYASGSIGARAALGTMAPLTLLGARRGFAKGFGHRRGRAPAQPWQETGGLRAGLWLSNSCNIRMV